MSSASWLRQTDGRLTLVGKLCHASLHQQTHEVKMANRDWRRVKVAKGCLELKDEYERVKKDSAAKWLAKNDMQPKKKKRDRKYYSQSAKTKLLKQMHEENYHEIQRNLGILRQSQGRR
jgi:hypothetical protein